LYDVKIETKSREVKTYLDRKLIFDETLPPLTTLLAIAGRDKKTGDVIAKVLNVGDTPSSLEVSVKGVSLSGAGTITQLSSSDGNAENSFDDSRRIAPCMISLKGLANNFTLSFPSHSLSILHLKTKTFSTSR